jgi:hypothetical protein
LPAIFVKASLRWPSHIVPSDADIHDKENQIAIQLGHRRPNLRVTSGYGEWDPEYLREAAKVLDVWFIKVWRRAQKLRQERELSQHNPDLKSAATKAA